MKVTLAVMCLGAAARFMQPDIKDPCGSVTCGELQCPGGFTPVKKEGHCCPYCENPNIKLERAVNGPSGAHGGKPSPTCADIWCFPTLCTGTQTAPTTTNKLCCPRCEA